jgi:hypothetical protein
MNKLWFLFIGLFVGFLFSYLRCTKNIVTTKEKQVLKTILKTDTVINRQVITRKKVVQKLDTLYKILEVPRNIIVKDSAKCDSIYSLVLEQKALISLDDSLICNYSNQISNYKELVKIKNKIIDSVSLRPRKAFFKGVGVGFVIGAGLGLIKR